MSDYDFTPIMHGIVFTGELNSKLQLALFHDVLHSVTVRCRVKVSHHQLGHKYRVGGVISELSIL